MRRGEVWWVNFSSSQGSEIRKTRPAVIVSNDAANRHLARIVVIPLSSNVSRCYVSEALILVNGKRAKVMADQIATVDKSRLGNLFGIISKNDMLMVEQAIKLHLALSF